MFSTRRQTVDMGEEHTSTSTKFWMRFLRSSFVPIIFPVTLSAVMGQYQPGQNWHVGQCKTKLRAALLSVPLIATRPALRNASRARNVLKGLFKCNQCRAEFTENANLSRHRRTMHAAVPSVFVCHICTRTFNRSDNMHMHIKNVHGGGSVVASKWSTLQLQTCLHGRTCLVSSGALQCVNYHMWWLGRYTKLLLRSVYPVFMLLIKRSNIESDVLLRTFQW